MIPRTRPRCGGTRGSRASAASGSASTSRCCSSRPPRCGSRRRSSEPWPRLIEGRHQAAATVCRVPADFLPDRCLTLGEDGRLRFFLPQGAGVTRRQDAAPLYYRDGTCYARTRQSLVEEARDVEADCAAVVIDRFVVNIDEPFELELAEFVLSRGGTP